MSGIRFLNIKPLISGAHPSPKSIISCSFLLILNSKRLPEANRYFVNSSLRLSHCGSPYTRKNFFLYCDNSPIFYTVPFSITLSCISCYQITRANLTQNEKLLVQSVTEPSPNAFAMSPSTHRFVVRIEMHQPVKHCSNQRPLKNKLRLRKHSIIQRED